MAWLFFHGHSLFKIDQVDPNAKIEISASRELEHDFFVAYTHADSIWPAPKSGTNLYVSL